MRLEERNRPRIYLLDCSEKIYKELKDKGYEVIQGSLGFRDGRRNLPKPLYEFDVLFYDLIQPKKYIEGEPKSVILPVGMDSQDASQVVEDTTPLSKMLDLTERIYRGGIFVTFLNQGVIENLSADSLNVFDGLPGLYHFQGSNDDLYTCTHQAWEQMFTDERELRHPIRATLPVGHFNWQGKNYRVESMIENSNKQALATYCKFGDGFIFLLPEFNSNDEAILFLLNELLPRVKEDLFPKSEVQRWMSSDEYEFEDVLKIKRRLKELEERFKNEESELIKRMDEEKEKLKKFKGLLIATDDEEEFGEGEQLNDYVDFTLRYLGFKIVCVDRGVDEEGRDRGKDYHIEDGDFFALVEVVGTKWEAEEKFFNKLVGDLNYSKFISKRSDLNGLLVVNFFRHREPRKRNDIFEDHLYREKIIKESQRQKVGLLSTWELYEMLQLEKKGLISKEQAREMLKRPGLIKVQTRKAEEQTIGADSIDMTIRRLENLRERG